MSLLKQINIELDSIRLEERIEHLSYYNHNIYKINCDGGDYYNFFGNDYVLLETEDDSSVGSAYFGKIINGNFEPAFMISFDAYNSNF